MRRGQWGPADGFLQPPLSAEKPPLHINEAVSSVQIIRDAIWPHDDVETLSAYLQMGQNYTLANATSGPLAETPLHWAARHGCAAAVQILVSSGANPSKPNLLGQTPLHLACAVNHYAVAKAILDIHSQEGSALKAVHSLDTHLPMQCSLLGRHAASPRPQLITAETQNSLMGSTKNMDSIARLIQSEKKKGTTASPGETPFHYACRSGATECIELLLMHGADANKLGCNGDHPLILAASTGSAATLMPILATGVSTSVTNIRGETALHVAAGSGHHEEADCVKLLLDYDVDPSIRDHKGETAAHHAAAAGATDALRVLMEYGTPLTLETPVKNQPNGDITISIITPRSPLDIPSNIIVYAARHRSCECLTFLLQRMLEVRQRCLMPNADPTPQAPSRMEQELLALFPALLDKTAEGGTTLQLAISRSPQLAETLLDMCVYVSEKTGINNNIGAAPKVVLDLVLFKAPPRSTEIAVILGLSHRARQKMLNHPLAQILLALKWRKVRYLYWLLVVLHLVFLFIVLTRVVLAHGALLGNRYELNGTDDEPVNLEAAQDTSITVARWVLSVFCMIMALIELLKIVRAGPSRYFRWDDNGREYLLNWFVILLACIDVSNAIPGSWARVLAAALALSACFQMLGVMSRFPYIGVYVVMIHRVMRSIATVLFAYIWLYIGFAIAFHVLLHDNRAADTNNPPLAVLKVVIMFVGEYAFPDAFEGADAVLTWAAMILLALFVPTMTILLLNLIIGLTVTDMRRLFQQAYYHRQVLLAQLVLYLSALLPVGASSSVDDDVFNLKTMLTVELIVDGDEADACLRLETAEAIINAPKSQSHQSDIVHNVELSEYTVEKLRRVLERRWGYSGAFYAPISPSSTFPSRTPTPTHSTSSSDSEVGDTLEYLQRQQKEQQAHTDQLTQLTMQVLTELQTLRNEIRGNNPVPLPVPSTPQDESATRPTSPTSPILEPPHIVGRSFSTQFVHRPIPGRRRQWTSFCSTDTNVT